MAKSWRTNTKPKVVAAYYVDFLREKKSIPLDVWTDGGTENTLIHDMQNTLQLHYAADGPAGVLIGWSVNNQRIKRYWRYLHRQLQMITNLLKDLSAYGHFI